MHTSAHILVVDDSPTIRRVVEQALRAVGYEVTSLGGGEQALAEVPRTKPDLLLLDFMMPGMNGYQVAKALSERDALDAPVVLMCTRGDHLPEQLLRSLGIVDTITKPFAPEAVVELVGYALERHAERREKGSTPVGGVLDEETEELAVTRPDLRALAPTSEGALDGDVAAAAALKDLTRVLADALFARGIDDADSLASNITAQVRQGLSSALLRELVAREIGTDALRRPTPSLYGDLAAVPLPEVLQLLKFQGQTGILEVSLGDARFEAAFRDGRIVAIRSRNARAELRLGQYFLSRGSLTKEQLEEALKEPAQGKAIGQRLLERGLIDHDALTSALGAQAEDLMYEMLRARRGIFGLRRGTAALEGLPTTGPGFSVDALLLEGLRRIDEWAVIEKEVPSFDARYRRARSASAEGLEGDEARVFEVLPAEGSRAVRELFPDVPLRPYDVCRVLYRLLMLGRAVRVDEEGRERTAGEDGGVHEEAHDDDTLVSDGLPESLRASADAE